MTTQIGWPFGGTSMTQPNPSEPLREAERVVSQRIAAEDSDELYRWWQSLGATDQFIAYLNEKSNADALAAAPWAAPSSDEQVTLDAAWKAAEAALPERDERALTFWYDTRKPEGWRAAAVHRFNPLRPIPLVVKGEPTPAAALHALAARLSETPR